MDLPVHTGVLAAKESDLTKETITKAHDTAKARAMIILTNTTATATEIGTETELEKGIETGTEIETDDMLHQGDPMIESALWKKKV